MKRYHPYPAIPGTRPPADRRFHAVIFDMDGVIVDTEPVYINWLRRFLEANHVWADEEEILRMAGISSQSYRKNLELWWRRAGKHNLSGPDIYETFYPFIQRPVFILALDHEHRNPVIYQLQGAMEEICGGHGFCAHPLHFLKDTHCKEIGLAPKNPGSCEHGIGLQRIVLRDLNSLRFEFFPCVDQNLKNILHLVCPAVILREFSPVLQDPEHNKISFR